MIWTTRLRIAISGRAGIIDEELSKAGNQLWNAKSKNISRRMRGLVTSQSTQVKPFVENIKLVGRMYNEPLELMFDDKYLYLKG